MTIWKKYAYIILLVFLLIGLFFPVIGLIALICMISPIVVSFFRGRYWCGNLCPRGNFFDQVLTRKNKRKTPDLLKKPHFKVAVLLVLFANMIVGIYLSDGSLTAIGLILYRLIVVTTIIGILLGSIYSHRAWCMFCPMGTLSSVIAKFRNKHNYKKMLKIDQTCISCKACSKNCPISLEPHSYKGKAITDQNCIQCEECVRSCPKDLIS